MLITPAKVAQLKAAVADKTQPNYTAWLALLRQANKAVGRTPAAPTTWFVPNRYDDPNGEYTARLALQNDANDSFALAVAYAVTGNTTYATQAVKFIAAWSSVKSFTGTLQTKLSWSYHFPAMIFAADLLRPSAQFTPQRQTAFTALITTTLPLMSTAWWYTDNLGSWGVLFEIASASYLKDHARFDKAIARHKAIQQLAINSTGDLVFEVHRQGGTQGNGSSGLWYINFALMPMTYTAEVARVNGVDLYNYTSPNGGNINAAYKKVAAWSAKPTTFTYNTSGQTSTFSPLLAGYYEILNARWPDSNATAILNANRPVQARHSIIGQTFLYGGYSGSAAQESSSS